MLFFLIISANSLRSVYSSDQDPFILSWFRLKHCYMEIGSLFKGLLISLEPYWSGVALLRAAKLEPAWEQSPAREKITEN